MQFHKVAVALGAEVSGIDLREPLSETDVRTLRAGLAEHQVLFFRDQDIDPEHHRALALHFGDPVRHPAYPNVEGYDEINILQSSEDAPTKIDTWHSDMTFMERPPLGSILRARIVPEVGGDTMFASMAAAYAALSERMRTYLEGLTAVHSFAYGFRHSLAEPGGWQRLEEAVHNNPPRHHPVVRTHPTSGAHGLFVNRLFTTHLMGVDEAESEAILTYLYDHLERAEYCCRFRWRPNSIAFWDNRATLHRPVNDYFPAPRVMERITIAGDRPR